MNLIRAKCEIFFALHLAFLFKMINHENNLYSSLQGYTGRGNGEIEIIVLLFFNQCLYNIRIKNVLHFFSQCLALTFII